MYETASDSGKWRRLTENNQGTGEAPGLCGDGICNASAGSGRTQAPLPLMKSRVFLGFSGVGMCSSVLVGYWVRKIQANDDGLPGQGMRGYFTIHRFYFLLLAKTPW